MRERKSFAQGGGRAPATNGRRCRHTSSPLTPRCHTSRFFESEWFDTWIAVTYLYKSTSPGVQDYLCNRLYGLPEADVERYLSQLCQLCVSRPRSPLERVMVDLCAQSLRLAVKTYWLLLAISQDQPRNTHVAQLRDWCEQAALEGHWELPFHDSRLLLSPVRSRVNMVALLSSGGAAAAGAGLLANSAGVAGASTPHSPEAPGLRGHAALAATLAGTPVPSGGGGWRGSVDGLASAFSPGRPLSPDVPSRPMSPEGLGGGLFSTVFMDTGVEGLMYEEPPNLRLTR